MADGSLVMIIITVILKTLVDNDINLNGLESLYR